MSNKKSGQDFNDLPKGVGRRGSQGSNASGGSIGSIDSQEFAFLGFDDSPFGQKGNKQTPGNSDRNNDLFNELRRRTPKTTVRVKGDNRSRGGSRAKTAKHEAHADPEAEAEAQILHDLIFQPFMAPKGQNRRSGLRVEGMNQAEDTDEYCTEIVEQLRHSTNSLIDEMKESRKVAKESADESSKRVVDAIKEMHSDLKQTLQELPKLSKK